jgi:hypothetical protein
MTYTKKQFIEDVKKEARALREHATEEEMDKLSLDLFDPQSRFYCIYGSLTGYCRSERAVELISKCCIRFFKGEALVFLANTEKGQEAKAISTVIKHVNGEKSDNPRHLVHVSAIETYIYMPDALNKNLIDYLKGNRNDLVL